MRQLQISAVQFGSHLSRPSHRTPGRDKREPTAVAQKQPFPLAPPVREALQEEG
ncbi:MAG: hypothetical protein AAF614_31945 [Chloroflexota bacterium]